MSRRKPKGTEFPLLTPGAASAIFFAGNINLTETPESVVKPDAQLPTFCGIPVRTLATLRPGELYLVNGANKIKMFTRSEPQGKSDV